MILPKESEYPLVDQREPDAQAGESNVMPFDISPEQFLQHESQDQNDPQRFSLDDEIAMLRVVTRRVFDLSGQVDDLQDAVKTLGALGMAATRLARLLEARKNLGQGDETMEMLSEVLSDLLKEWGRE